MKYLKSIYNFILLLLLGGACWSCSDDNLYPDPNKGPEGEPVTLSLNLTLPERSSYTRADLSAADDNRVNSLWVGIYNVASGEFTGGGVMTAEKNGFQAGEKRHDTYQLTNIETKSGDSRIVAVANYDNHLGVMNGVEDNLIDLLIRANTWDKFCNIAAKGALAQDTDVKIANIETPEVGETSALLMSGIFTEGVIEDHESGYWESQANNSVYIPTGGDGQALLTGGAIHLRRLMSHIKFTLQATGNIISIEPLSYKVFNVPTYNWLHERFSGDNVNAGDALQPDYAQNKNYPSSLLFTSTAIGQNTTGTGNNATTQYTFDFWQMENKRSAVEGHCAVYGDRELMYGEGFSTPNATGDPYTQSEYFYSLCDGRPSLNNKATYVDIPCVIKYRATTTNQPTIDGTQLPNGATRTANVTYRIHLGYVGQNPDPKDFNSLRNSEYTYSVTVSDVNKVILEAFRQSDQTPGAIGNVTDVTDQFFELDSHFGVLNIYLSDEDLTNFSFSMETYDSYARRAVFAGLQGEADNIPAAGTTEYYDYYDWIELVKAPITGTHNPDNVAQSRTLAVYPGKGGTGIYHLKDIVDKKEGLTAGWYTVFVREYTFEKIPGQDGYGNETGDTWTRYVGQPNRNVWLNVAERTSTDGHTAYYRAKYAISQKSIQTYYSTTNLNDGKNALAVEHTNETFGLNLRWTTDAVTSDLHADNGRFNTWLGVGGVDGGTTAGRWNTYVNRGNQLHVNPVNNQEYSNGTDGNVAYVAQPVFLTGLTQSIVYDQIPNQSNLSSRVPFSTATPYDPQTNAATAQYIQTINACLNRNRDENGDGTIDAPEMKWYLASSGHYLRLILGRNALPNPMMNYAVTTSTPYNSSSNPENTNGQGRIGNGYNGRYHYVSSDGKMVWAEEGISSSSFLPLNSDKLYATAPWQLRCVRSLGTNLTTVTKTTKVDPAYSCDPVPREDGSDAWIEGGVVQIESYYGTSLRNMTTSVIAPHYAYEDDNRLGQYGFEYGSIQEINGGDEQDYVAAINNNTNCSDLNTTTGRTGWRTPNQKEVIIMGRIGVLPKRRITDNLDRSRYTFWWSCTRESYGSNGRLGGAGSRWVTYRASDRFGGASNSNDITALRCVRDLTAAEAEMTYDQITSQTRARKTKKKQ